MLLFICLFGFVITALGAPVENASEPVTIVSEVIETDPSGKFKYSYESGDGSKQEQSGELKTIGTEGKEGEAVQGSYEYTAPDGTHVLVSYTADENGYQPHGDVLPVEPPLPPSVARSLKFIEEHPTTQEPAKVGAS